MFVFLFYLNKVYFCMSVMFHGPYLFSPLMLQNQSVRHLLISSKGLNTLHIFCPDLEFMPVVES